MPFAYRLFFLRHGETDWNAEGRLQGQQDIQLNAVGRFQAAEAGRAVINFLGADASGILAHLRFIASPMLRTRETMEIARSAMGLPTSPYELDARLKELTFGSWEGMTWKEVQKRFPEAARARTKDKWTFVPPAGESYEMLSQRIQTWLDDIHQDCLIVSHGGVARALMNLIAGVSSAQAPLVEIKQGRPILFEAGGYRWL